MAKHIGDKGGVAAWRKAHDAMAKHLEAAEAAEADDEGGVEVDYAACRDGYRALGDMFRSKSGAGGDSEVDHRRDFESGSADSSGGMALDMRAAPPMLTPRQAAASEALEAFGREAHAPRNQTG